VETSFDGDVPAGESITGEIAYEIPKGEGDLVLDFDPILGGNKLSWSLDE
jgi:hypothetical protein